MNILSNGITLIIDRASDSHDKIERKRGGEDRPRKSLVRETILRREVAD